MACFSLWPLWPTISLSALVASLACLAKLAKLALGAAYRVAQAQHLRTVMTRAKPMLLPSRPGLTIVVCFPLGIGRDETL